MKTFGSLGIINSFSLGYQCLGSVLVPPTPPLAWPGEDRALQVTALGEPPAHGGTPFSGRSPPTGVHFAMFLFIFVLPLLFLIFFCLL